MMDTETAVIDTTALARLEEWGGKRLLSQMIDLFLQHSPERIEGMREGLQLGSLSEVERAAHSLKSTAANLGAGVLTGIAAQAEAAAAQKNLDIVRELFPTIEAEFHRAKEVLDCLGQGGV